MADDGPAEPTREPPKPGNRRAKLLIAVGVVLLIVALLALASRGDDDAASTPRDPDAEPGEVPAPGPGLEDGADSTDWELVLAAVGAVSGLGSLVLGVADFHHKNRRLARDRRHGESDWRDGSGYL